MTVLYTASFYQPDNWVGRCFRVSRHHPRGRKAQWDTLPFLYPELQLLKSYRSGEVNFEAFSHQYRNYLNDRYTIDHKFRRWVDEDLPRLGDCTLLCFEREGALCHRLVLARWLSEVQPYLEIGALR